VIHLLANGPGNVTAGGGLANTDYYDPTYVSQASLLNQDNSSGLGFGVDKITQQTLMTLLVILS
jgi:hypothetical protein